MRVVFSTCIWRTYIFPNKCILEKSVENKSFSKLNFKKLLFSTLFSRTHCLRDKGVAHKSVRNSYGVKNKAPQAEPGAAPLAPPGGNKFEKRLCDVCPMSVTFCVTW